MECDLRDLTVEDWRQLVDDANSSDLTKREWCARAGIAEKTLYYWQRKFREEDMQQQTEEGKRFLIPRPNHCELLLHGFSPWQ